MTSNVGESLEKGYSFWRETHSIQIFIKIRPTWITWISTQCRVKPVAGLSILLVTTRRKWSDYRLVTCPGLYLGNSSTAVYCTVCIKNRKSCFNVPKMFWTTYQWNSEITSCEFQELGFKMLHNSYYTYYDPAEVPSSPLMVQYEENRRKDTGKKPISIIYQAYLSFLNEIDLGGVF